MRLSRLLVAVVPLALAGCLGSTEPTAYATVAGTTYSPDLGVDLANSTKLPDGVYYRDVTVGTGNAIAQGDSVGVYYVGNVFDGTPFDSLTVGAPNAPLRFRVGTQNLLLAFQEGVTGMQVGGRRQILIPPDLAYGLTGASDANGFVLIPGNAVIVFMVDAAAIY
jgi:peptidylprolyl isomerase